MPVYQINIPQDEKIFRFMENNMLISYLRDPKSGQKTGIVVSTARSRVGFALCNKKDRWNQELGLRIAIGRCQTYWSVEDWKVNLLSETEKIEGRSVDITVSFLDWLSGNCPTNFSKPAFQFKDEELFHTLRPQLLDKIVEMYGRSLKYYKQNQQNITERAV